MAESDDKLADYKAITLRCDTASDYMPTVPASTGDRNGRRIRAVLTNAGKDVDPAGITARILYDPEPDNPKVFGDLITMTPVPDTATATFEAPIPVAALQTTGRKTLGLQFVQHDGEPTQSTVVTRPFTLQVEAGVLKVTSGDATGEFEDAVRRAETARDQAQASAQAADASEKLAAQHLKDIGTSKTDAATSATNAKTSETNAKTSETNSKTSETNAKTSETNAAASAAAALASEKAAKTSETNAKTSETNAATSAAAALASEQAAKTSETNAAASAAQATASDEQAGRYADAAGQSATDAASSATTATQASTAALASETNAKTSETNAATSAKAARDAVDGFGLIADRTDTLTPGAKATVAITKDGNTYHATFGIPQGEKGENTAAISEITLEYTPGDGIPDIHVEAGGTPTDRTIKFIMSNLEGTDGHTPVITVGTVTTLDPGAKATLDAVTDGNGDVTLNIGIPRGADGADASVTDANVSAVLDQPLSTAKIRGIAGAANTTQTITYSPDDFTQDDQGLWHADKPATGLGTINLAAPVSTWDNVQAYSSAGPVIADHGDDPAIPDGSIRCTCQAQPADPFTIRITTIIKEQ